MPDFSLLAPLIRELHSELIRVYYMALPVFFLMAIMFAWIKYPAGGSDFVDVIKRTIIASLLLAAFPEISEAISGIASGVAEIIDKQNTLAHLMELAQNKLQSYPNTPATSLLRFNTLFISVLTFSSYFILCFARYGMIALYHFYWVFYSVISPLILLFSVFPSMSGMVRNMFKGMMEVAAWKIVWAILAAMLAALSLGNVYSTEGSYITIIILNFIIAIAMLMTPRLVSSLVDSGIQSGASATQTAAIAVMAAGPQSAVNTVSGSKEVSNNIGRFAKNAWRSNPSRNLESSNGSN